MKTTHTGSNIPYMIAEIGINHSGSLELARKMIQMAKDTGFDAVKFQRRTIPIVYTQEFLDSPRESPWGNTQRAQKVGLELLEQDYDHINALCVHLEIDWFASAWDIPALEALRKYDLKHNKVASAMLTHKEFVHEVAKEGKHTFISTGMSDYTTIDAVVDEFDRHGTPYTLMHCVAKYPCPDEECNIAMISTLQSRYNVPVGYSGHEEGLRPSILAAAWGAVAIERHITHSRAAYGSDQGASLERHGMELLVRDCKDIDKVIGDGMKRILPEELVCAKKLRYWEE